MLFYCVVSAVMTSPAEWDEMPNDRVWTPETSDDSPTVAHYDDLIPWRHQNIDAFTQVATEPLEGFIDPSLPIEDAAFHGPISDSEENAIIEHDRDPSILDEFIPYYLESAPEDDMLSALAEDLRLEEDARDPLRGRTAAERARHRARLLARRNRRDRHIEQARLNRDHFDQIFEYARIREGRAICRSEWMLRLRRREPAALRLQDEYWSLFR